MGDLDIVIPVYNEGANILSALTALAREVKTPFRVLICYDSNGDDTLTAIRGNADRLVGVSVEFVQNAGQGPHQAVTTGFKASAAPCVIVYPADDDYNAGILDAMVAKARGGCDIVCASRFMRGGSMIGCPWPKAILVRAAAFTLHHFAGVPTHDASNGFRLFSRRAIETISIESNQGFCYSIELLVKAHRLGWAIGEVPAQWSQRKQGKSRFRLMKWIVPYLRWYFYAFATTWLGPVGRQHSSQY
jgi:dolichol-phosphate mannosyltransferase